MPSQLDSALGESIYLSKAVGDALTGDMTQVAFGALLNALSPVGWAPVPGVNDVTGDGNPSTNGLPTDTPHSLYRCRVRLRPSGD